MALDYPDRLRETSLRDVFVPLNTSPYLGPPLGDLIDVYGVAPGEAGRLDKKRWPLIDLPVDGLGFPNAVAPERTDILLVGDSFLVSAGSVEPSGLARSLAEASGRAVYNLGVSAIGSLQELSLLLAHGLPKKPSVVVWFFFGGNDVMNVRETLLEEARGTKNWAEFYQGRLRPRWILADLVGFYVAGDSEEPRPESLDPFLLPGPEGEPAPLWFSPPYLLGLTLAGAQIERLPAWRAIEETLSEAREATESIGAEFLVVFLPSKAQVYLPHVIPDPDLAFRAANHGGTGKILEPETLLDTALKNRMELERLLGEYCAEQGIDYLSATPALEALAERGELGFLQTDSHWSIDGQRALLPELETALRTLLERQVE